MSIMLTIDFSNSLTDCIQLSWVWNGHWYQNVPSLVWSQNPFVSEWAFKYLAAVWFAVAVNLWHSLDGFVLITIININRSQAYTNIDWKAYW